MNKRIMNALVFAVFCLAGVSASATPIEITSYDVHNARLTGTGGWSHAYSGEVKLNSNGTYDYTGGGGTLNDGVIGTGTGNTHLFQVGDQSVITLYLGTSSIISELELYSFAGSGNHIPGNILGLYVTINGVTEYIQTSGFGPANPTSKTDHVHEYLNLAGTALDGLVTDSIMLSGFVSDGSWSTHYSISEVMAYGTPAASVAEPTGVLLLGAGLMGLGMIRRRKR